MKKEDERFVGYRPLVIAPPSQYKATDPPVPSDENVSTRECGYFSLLVAFGSFWTNGTIFGLINSFGVLYIRFAEKFEDSSVDLLGLGPSSLAALIGSLCIGTTFLLSLLAGILSDLFGIRKTALIGSVLATLGMFLCSFVLEESPILILLTYGVLVGAGASLAYTPSLVIIGHYFSRWIGIVNGFVTAGSSLFTICMPFLMEWLLKNYGLSVTLQCLSAMLLTLVICTAIFKPQKAATKSSEARESNSCCNVINTSIWRNKRYVIWALAIPSALFGYFVPYVHLVNHVRKILPNEDGKVLVMCIGASSGVGRIIFGLLADLLKKNRILFQQISFYAIGCLTLILPFARDFYYHLIPLCLGLGLFDGCFISLLGPIAFDLVGADGASQAIGFLLGFCSIPLTVGPPVAGWMYDHFDQTYDVAFLCAGIPPIVGATLMFLINCTPPPVDRNRAINSYQDNNDNTKTEEQRKMITASSSNYINLM